MTDTKKPRFEFYDRGSSATISATHDGKTYLANIKCDPWDIGDLKSVIEVLDRGTIQHPHNIIFYTDPSGNYLCDLSFDYISRGTKTDNFFIILRESKKTQFQCVIL